MTKWIGFAATSVLIGAIVSMVAPSHAHLLGLAVPGNIVSFLLWELYPDD